MINERYTKCSKCGSFFRMVLDEANYKQLRNGVDPKTKSRTKPLKAMFKGYKNGCLLFKCRSGTVPGLWYDEKVRLLDLDRIIKKGGLTHFQMVKKAVMGDIKVTCTCPAHRYWGSAYRLTKLNAEETLTHLTEPEINLGIPSLLCKHLDTVLFSLPFNVAKITKVLEKAGVFNK